MHFFRRPKPVPEVIVPTDADAERLRTFLKFASEVAKDNPNAVGRLIEALPDCRSQFMQDAFAILTSGMKDDGFFVEFGACDGLEISNSLVLEQRFGWRGILAEPGRNWHESLATNRTAKIDQRCVWGRSGDRLTFNETSFPDRSQVSKFYVPAAGEITATYEVETVSLADLLTDHDAPAHIDFLSMDVEGAESDVLSAFPFDRYTFGFICVEQHGEAQAHAVRSIMKAAGYDQIHERISAYDGWYVPEQRDNRGQNVNL
jgi:FkbM family methyltransferase|tara:strand:- start:10335 stop:11114 length:780 start_codon:yes stop_codon:yes gene_type:complete